METSSNKGSSSSIGRKEITEKMVTNFAGALDTLQLLKPHISWTATALIQEHYEQINALLEQGYTTQQIADILEQELGLSISPTLIRRALKKASN